MYSAVCVDLKTPVECQNLTWGDPFLRVHSDQLTPRGRFGTYVEHLPTPDVPEISRCFRFTPGVAVFDRYTPGCDRV